MSAINGHAQPQKTNGNVDGNFTESTTPPGEPVTTPASKDRLQNRTRGKPVLKFARHSVVDAVDEVTTTDHKSFVQNVFGTVAFKMLEWLTPRKLEIMAAEGVDKGSSVDGDQPLSRKDGSSPSSQVSDKSDDDEVSKLGGPANMANGDMQADDLTTTMSQNYDTQKSPTTSKGEPTPNSTAPETLPNTTAMRPSSPTLRRKTEHKESQLPKGILNISTSPKTADMISDIRPLTRELLNPASRKKSQQNVTGSKVQVAKTAPVHEKLAPPEVEKLETSEVNDLKGAEAHRDGTRVGEASTETSTQPEEQLEVEDNPSTQVEPRQVLLPQSLEYLSVELIDFICDILQMDGKCERHSLQPETLDSSLKRDLWTHMVTLRRFFYDRIVFSENKPSISSRDEWRTFIEQSLFDVLSRPESLLKSFTCNYKKRFFDTQTIWYLMLRMTRVAPSLVFDSLWIAAGTLFQPPEKIESIYEWPKETSSQTRTASRNLSNIDAARVMNLCLHALVATAPLVTDARRLANMSRIRSYGLTMLGRNMASLEPVALCLQYDDAFTNDLALRLARRLFAAIPTRRRFTELLELQQDARSEEAREQDILDTVLSSLTSLETSPMMHFSAEERMLHEARVPVLILDWARTVMLQDWEGAAEVPGDGSFGGALAMMAAICELIQFLTHIKTDPLQTRTESRCFSVTFISVQSTLRKGWIRLKCLLNGLTLKQIERLFTYLTIPTFLLHRLWSLTSEPSIIYE
jgi:hypothetical protein